MLIQIVKKKNINQSSANMEENEKYGKCKILQCKILQGRKWKTKDEIQLQFSYIFSISSEA